MKIKKKLIEVALPLDAINTACSLGRRCHSPSGHIHSTLAPLVGASTAGGGAGGDFRADGG